MEKMIITSGENKVNIDTGLTGNGTSENPLQYTGEIQHSDKRSLLWESTANDYNTNIQLSEPITHFDKVMIYGSGLENNDTMHLSKNVYTVQSGLINGCDVWCYSPWTTSFQANYILGADLKLSGNSGHIGSSYYWGIGSKNATWAAGKWTGTDAPKMLMPWKIFGIDRHPTYNFYGLPSEGGSVSSNLESGYAGDTGTITAIPESDVWKMSALNITGAELTGNDFMFTNSNVTAQAEFEHSRNLTLENGDHGVLSADKMSGFSGDVVTIDATTDEGWYLSGLDITGAVATGTKFMFIGNNVTALGKYTDVGFPVTYLADEHVSVEGPSIYIPGGTGLQLQSSYDPYYRIDYEITNGEIVDGLLVPSGPCTVYAKDKINYFTATGNFEQGSDVSVLSENSKVKTANVPAKYALHQGHTGDIPSSWYDISNRWKPNDASAYSITLNTKMSFSISASKTIYGGTKGELTAGTLIGNTLTNTAVSSKASNTSAYYNKTVTTTEQNVNYGVSAKLYAVGYYYYHPDVGTMQTKFRTQYYATGTTGTWTATGIAP